MDRRTALKKLITLSLTSAALGFSLNSFASAFYLPTYSAADLGEANAGGAALAQDAATAYSNPAGLTNIHNQQLVISAIGFQNPVKFNGTAAAPGAVQPLGDWQQTGSARSSVSALVPAFYYALPLTNNFTFGLSMISPYGLGDDYQDTSLVRYDVTKAQIISENINPNLAYKVNDQLSVAIGFDALYANLMQRNMARTQPLTTSDSMTLIQGSGWGYGWNAGLLYQFTPATRVGLSYRSQIVDELDGNSKFYMNGGPAGGIYSTNNFKVSLHLPPTATLSAYHDMTQQWAIMSSVDYLEWSTYKNLHLYNVATPAGASIANIPQNFHDSWRYAVGTSYQLTPRWKLRAGVDYDQTPISDTYRDQALPGADRYDVAVGARYAATKNLNIDAAYYHAFMQTVKVNSTSPTSNANVTGTSHGSADALGLQLEWNFI